MPEPDDAPTPPPTRLGPRRPPRVDRKRRVLIGAVLVTFVLFLSARGIARFITDVLWFNQLGYGRVFRTILLGRLGLGVVFGLLGGAAILVNLVAADRLAPRALPAEPEDLFITRYRELMKARGGRIRLVTVAAFGVMFGAPVAGRWNDWLMFRHGVSFGAVDPLFKRDIGFYVFKLPFESFLVDWAFATVLVATLVTAAAHYLNGGIRLQVLGRRVTPQVKYHLSALLALLALLKAANYWLDRYKLLSSTRGYVDGAGYTDVKAQLPATLLLLLISLLAAALLLYNVRQRGWRLPVIAVGLWLVVAVVAGQAYPAAVQRFTVGPSESNRERPYIERNIAATRVALGLDNIEVRDFKATVPSENMSDDDLANIRRARLIDPLNATNAFTLLKGNVGGNGHFRFLDGSKGGLDVNRMTVDGKVQPVVSAVRELNPVGGQQNSWENRHLAYTHGIGLIVANGNSADPIGQPVFLDDATTGLTRPQVYVGEDMRDYAVVRTKVPEIDGTTTAPYAGQGGVSLSSRLRRALFALRYGEWNLFGSSNITSDSRIVFKRDIKERVQALAPFLSIGSDPYAVVSDGRLLWVLDGFTTTDRYPYAQHIDTRELPSSSGLSGERFNFVRDSVKIVVDAYDGSVSFYLIDETDPLALTYARAFPSLFQSKKELPAAVVSTLRYPQDLFQVQSSAWGTYRLDGADTFYNRNGAWNVSPAPRREQERNVASVTSTTIGVPTTRVGLTPAPSNRAEREHPYYSYVQLPGDNEPTFASIRTYVPRSENDDRRELQAFMVASSERGSYGALRVYRVPEPLPPGPVRVDADTSKQFSEVLTKLDQQGSSVHFGDLQLVPLGQSLAWLRTWFLVSSVPTDSPKLDSVTITVGNTTYRGTTVDDAISLAFKGSGTPAPTATPTAPGGAPSVEQLLADADRLRQEALAALKKPSFDEYRTKMEAAYAKVAEAASIATGKPVGVNPTAAAAATNAAIAPTTTAPLPATTTTTVAPTTTTASA